MDADWMSRQLLLNGRQQMLTEFSQFFAGWLERNAAPPPAISDVVEWLRAAGDEHKAELEMQEAERRSAEGTGEG